MGMYSSETLEDLAYAESEGSSDFLEDEVGEIESELEVEDDFESELEDDFGESGEDFLESEADWFESEDGAEAEAEAAYEDAIAYALGAESTDEFFGRLFKGIKNVATKVGGAIKKAAPVVGQIARAAGPLLSKIPHPWAQAAGGVANLLGQLRAEGATEEEALEAVAELAARDPRALPVVAGIAARTLVKNRGASMPPAQRKAIARTMMNTAKGAVRRQGPKGARTLARVTNAVKRTTAVRGTPPAAKPKVVQRTLARVNQKPALAQKLARPSPAAVQRIRTLGPSANRTFTIAGPTRITISSI